MRIEVLIDELVLHGFEPDDRHALRVGLGAELARLLAPDAAGWTRPRAGDVERVVAPGVRLAPGAAAAPALAGAVHAAIATAVTRTEVKR
jgi:hypothetical protein